MDKIDKRLIKELSENARVTISELSSKVSLSMPAVSERIRRLESDGYIGAFTVKLGEKYETAYPINMQSMVKLNKNEDEEEFQKFLDSNRYVTWYGNTAGHFDYVLHIMARDIKHVNELLGKINSFPAVVDMESDLILKQKRKNVANYL